MDLGFLSRLNFSLNIDCRRQLRRQLECMNCRSRYYHFWSSSASIGRKVIRILYSAFVCSAVVNLSVSMATTINCRCHCRSNCQWDCPLGPADWSVSLFGVDCRTKLVPLPFPCTGDRRARISPRRSVSDSRGTLSPMHRALMSRWMCVSYAFGQSFPGSLMDCLTYSRRKYSWKRIK